ncbi:NUDIX hydrolase [Glycomyces sp. A-F 0318]|uniref:NUDIX hydrolase n=1 Tax=Glycomyces amatae TaxID=2881355 RepID=UPI001E605A72|nr:NUDIX hydrolase [Glycomyces amatae]MCD0447187.1 NUDIX hydrolase [Glycomyces amatae]
MRIARRNRRWRRFFEDCTNKIMLNLPLDSPELNQNFQELPLLAHLKKYGWSTQAEFPAAECGIFVLAYQYYGHRIKITGFDAAALTHLADRASEDEGYRRVILMHALSTFIPKDQLASVTSEIEDRSMLRFRVTSRYSEADARLENRLQQTENDHLFKISTTSQISDFSRAILERTSRTLQSLTIAHLSPLFISDLALNSQAIEGTVPSDVIPKGQQLADRDVDVVRRTIRTIIGIKQTWNRMTNSDISLTTIALSKSHPGVKVRLLRKSGYLQLFPGRLNYADNLYRFGYEITESSLIATIDGHLETWISDNSTRYVSKELVDDLCERAVVELARWMLATPEIMSKMSEWRHQIFGLFPEEGSRQLIQLAFDIFAEGLEAMTTTSSRITPSQYKTFVRPAGSKESDRNVVLSVDNQRTHISAGVIVRSGGKILVVKKAKMPNRGKWSVPGGHCEWGESACMAALRELKEEVGIEANNMKLIYSGEINEGQPCRHGITLHTWFLYALDLSEAPSIQLEASELQEYRWVDENLLNRIRQKTPAFEILMERVKVHG